MNVAMGDRLITNISNCDFILILATETSYSKPQIIWGKYYILSRKIILSSRTCYGQIQKLADRGEISNFPDFSISVSLSSYSQICSYQSTDSEAILYSVQMTR